jgi:sortase A
MNNKIRIILTYIKMTMLSLVLGGIVLYIGGIPIASYLVAKGKMIITEGAPGEDGTIHAKSAMIIDKRVGNENMSEIQLPEEDTRYGTITCTQIALSAPIYYGDSKSDLENGVGQYPNGNLPGMGKPMIIGGHDGTYFAPLAKIKIGDLFNVSTDYGRFTYTVTSKKILDQADESAYDLSQEKEQLILYTCYPFGQLMGERSQRFFVYCEPVTESLPNLTGGDEDEIG